MIQVDHSTRVVRVDGRAARLPRQLYDLLLVLLEDPERVVPTPELEGRLWGCNDGCSRALNAAIVRLRRALGPGYVYNVWGVGYRLVAGAVS